MVFTTAVGFFLMPFLVHHLGDRMYGYWALIGAVLGYYGILDLGISPAVAFQLASAIGKDDKEAQNRTLSTAVVAFLGLGMVALIVTTVVALSCFLFIPSEKDVKLFRVVLTLVGLGFAIGFPGRAFMGGLYAHLRNDLISVISIATLALRTILIVGLLLRGAGIVGLALVSLTVEFATYLASYALLLRIQPHMRISLGLVDKHTFKELLNYGRHSMVIRIGDQFRFALDGWTVAAIVGIAAVAHYTIASRLSAYFITFILSVVSLLQSWFSQLLGKQNFDGIRRVLQLGTKVAAVLSTIVVTSFLFFGRTLIEQWMGATYVDAYWPSLILIMAVFCDLAQQPSVTYLMGVSKHRYLAVQTLIEGIFNLALSIYWGRTYGMVGVAMGTLVPMFVAKIILQPAYVCRSAGVSLSQYYLKDFGRAVAAPAMCSFMVWALLFRTVTLTNLAWLIPIVLLQASLTLSLSFYLVFDSAERRLVVRKFSSRKELAPEAA